ncbi:TldD/PmbA family protein [Clostridium sp. 'deep sea']|uniref:TldD/PmbA family protein n=1 Tax=Clostridium sp. 'deep sea' TaxID=2779445 RepID=UPI0018969261|nr:TldD/PmbA family protein [Clostridium sp. 'deep sea']QOR36522.1 TldD/PmbA family protein [Clostridium sp. 'deep sea']
MNINDLQQIAKKIIKTSQAEQTQVNIQLNNEAFSRFNENYIHQNLVRHTVSAQIKVAIGKQIGSITVSDISKWHKVENALNQAITIAKMQPPNKAFVSFPKQEEQSVQKNLDNELVNFTAQKRAEVIGQVIDYALSQNLEASGTFSINTGQMLVMNSLGLNEYTPYAHGFFRNIMNNGNCTGYADQVITSISNFTPLQLAELAAAKSLVCNNPLQIEAGKYTVLLEPIAVGDLLRFMAMHAFNGQAVEQKRSYLSKNMNKQIVDSRITITDNAHHEFSPHLPFDNEGVIRKVVPLIEQGVAKGAVYDSATAYQYNKPLTGHAGGYGCAPAFMVMNNGTSNISQMIKKIERGIIINRFHYTSCPEPYRVVATGTSRDGTMWIEDGKIKQRINNVRFTQSVIDTLNNIVAIGNDARPVRDWWSSFISLLPSLLVKDFNISGTTTF